MRLFLQILSLVCIAVLGWNQPFRDYAGGFVPWMGIAPSRLAVIKAKAKGFQPPNEPDGPAPTPMATVRPKKPFESTSSLNQPARR